MKDIYSVLHEKQKQLVILQREVDALRLAMKLLGEEKLSDEDTKLSQPLMAVAILEAMGKPLHVKNIAEQMKKRFKISVKLNNLSVMLYRYATRGRHFFTSSDKPNTYGLLKWEAEEPSKVVAMSS